MLIEALLVRVEAVYAALVLGGGSAPLKLQLTAVHHRTEHRERLGANVLASVSHAAHQVRKVPAGRK